MKKMLSILLSCSMLTSMAAATAFAEDKEISKDQTKISDIKYDVNKDGKTSTEDAIYILSICAHNLLNYSEVVYKENIKFDFPPKEYVLKTANLTSEQYDSFDLNNDGYITGEDARIILLDIAGKSGDEQVSKERQNEISKEVDKFYTIDSKVNTSSKDNLNYIKGDVNLDGKVDSSDATEVLVSYAENLIGKRSTEINANTTVSDINADVNLDGKIDSSDATEILVMYAENLINKK